MRLPVVLHQPDAGGLWLCSVPGLDVSGSGPSRAAAIEAAISAVENHFAWQHPSVQPDESELVFLTVTVDVDVPELLEWPDLQRISQQIRGTQWIPYEPDHDGTLVRQPSRWWSMWPSDERSVRIELSLIPTQLGLLLDFTAERGAAAYATWLKMRVGHFVANLTAYSDVCRVLAGPSPSPQEIAEIVATQHDN